MPSAGSLKVTIRVPIPKLSILPGESTSFAVFVMMMDENMRETPIRMFVHRVTAAELEDSVQSLKLDVHPGTYTVSFAIADSYSSQTSYLQREVTVPAN